jgi:glycosyltransferase involved in cell wall biosynthesis
MVASPHDRAPKGLRTGSCDIIYVGQLAEAKGLGDVLRGLRELRLQGVPARLSIVGGGDAERFRAQAAELHLADDVRFEGRIPHGRVIESMREHDVVVVPSRHEYPEGLPMTIYDALASRTPLVLSDHPMFTQRIVEGEGCLYFPAGSAEGLARRILELVGDAALYRKLSENAASVWESLRCPVIWGDLVSRWLSDTPEDRRWLEKRSLAAWEDSGANPGLSETGRP